MAKAYYMRFRAGDHGAVDHVGGLPRFLPPVPLPTDQGMGLLAEFETHPQRLPVPGAMSVQVYQRSDVAAGGDPMPVVLAIPEGSARNESNLGVVLSGVLPHDIEWEEREDPLDLPSGQDSATLAFYQAKAGGVIVFEAQLAAGSRGLLQLTEHPANLNLAGLMLVIYLDPQGQLAVELL